MSNRIVEPQDRAGAYAALVRAELRKADAPLTVRELMARLHLSERLIRDGLNRLVFLNEVVVRQRIVTGFRGLPPWTYALVAPTQ